MIVSRDTSGASYRPLAVPFQVYRDQVSCDLKRSLESHASGDALDDGVTTSFLPPLDAEPKPRAHLDPPLRFEPSLEPVSAGDTELLLHWRITHRGPEQNAQECGRENRDGDFTEIHWFNAPLIPYTKTPRRSLGGGVPVSL